MAEYPIHPYIIHCLEPLLANAAAPVVLALDGRCGSGKTTMAAALAEQFPDSIVLHTDDFYLPPADRVPGWEQTPCANMDLARLRDEVLAPARAGKPVLYRAYSCREGACPYAIPFRSRTPTIPIQIINLSNLFILYIPR